MALVCTRWKALSDRIPQDSLCVPHTRPAPRRDPCTLAARAGHLRCLRWALTRGHALSSSTFSEAAHKGRIPILAHLCDLGCPGGPDACAAAARHGQYDALVYLHERGCLWDERTTVEAELNCWVDCLRYALERDCPWPRNTQVKAKLARRTNDATYEQRIVNCLFYVRLLKRLPSQLLWREIVRKDFTHAAKAWLADCAFHVHDEGQLYAVRKGRKDILDMLTNAGHKWSGKCCFIAAQYGHADIVRHAHRTIDLRDIYMHNVAQACADEAFSSGNAHVFETLHACGCHIGEIACHSALQRGRVEALLCYKRMGTNMWGDNHWFHAVKEGGRPFVERAIQLGVRIRNGMMWGAATMGSVEIIRLLVEAGMPRYGKALYDAARNGHLDAVRYLYEQSGWYEREQALDDTSERNEPFWTLSMMDSIARGGHLDVLIYARQHGAPWDTTTCAGAAAAGRLSVLRYLHESGCPWDARTFIGATWHKDCMDYVRVNDCPEPNDPDHDELGEHYYSLSSKGEHAA